MHLTITRFLISSALALALSSCGAFTDETQVEIEMYGVTRAPTTATGDRDPQFQSYEVQSITLNSAEGDVLILSEPQTFKIVDRPQIILSYKADAFVGRSFTGITVVYSAAVVGGDNDEPALGFTLSSPTLAIAATFEIEESKSKTFSIKASWANTISTGAMTEPSFEFVAN